MQNASANRMGFASCFSRQRPYSREAIMSTAPALVSIGDQGVLNTPLPPSVSDIWIDRDLSSLDFNERVLAEALDERTPLLERAKFLALFTSNLDEFFMKRALVLHGGKSEAQRALLQQLREKLLP